MTEENKPLSVWITTYDNPWNPFLNWDEWYAFDEGQAYCTCGFLARLASLSMGDLDEEEDVDIEELINQIVRISPNAVYRKVKPDHYQSKIKKV